MRDYGFFNLIGGKWEFELVRKFASRRQAMTMARQGEHHRVGHKVRPVVERNGEFVESK